MRKPTTRAQRGDEAIGAPTAQADTADQVLVGTVAVRAGCPPFRVEPGEMFDEVLWRGSSVRYNTHARGFSFQGEERLLLVTSRHVCSSMSRVRQGLEAGGAIDIAVIAIERSALPETTVFQAAEQGDLPWRLLGVRSA
jgi:hypothetical protein